MISAVCPWCPPRQIAWGVTGTGTLEAEVGAILKLTNVSACIAAPMATTSSGGMEELTSLPGKQFWTRVCTLGIRADPPTSSTRSTSSAVRFAALRAEATRGAMRLSTDPHTSSNLTRERLVEKSTPSCADSTSSRALWACDSCFFVLSQPPLRRATERLLSLGSILYLVLNSLMHHASSASSILSPPKRWSLAPPFSSINPSVTPRITASLDLLPIFTTATVVLASGLSRP
mmetsp:Transcript_54868/g.128271  ORF Transcript_54868/g.128271 Transcript_54868/m.128271 type:complete len:232 (+) Transcript_54868:284-979(+)